MCIVTAGSLEETFSGDFPLPRNLYYRPDPFVDNEYEPNGLLHYGEHQQRQEHRPDYEEYLLVQNLGCTT